MRILIDCGVLEHMDQTQSAPILLHLLRALVRSNELYIRRHPETPHPYRAQIKYVREREAVHVDEIDEVLHERWLGVKGVIERGGGDCEDLASYLAAWELVHSGPRAGVRILWREMPDVGRVFHVVTIMADGTIEDPSRKLGMRTREA